MLLRYFGITVLLTSHAFAIDAQLTSFECFKGTITYTENNHLRKIDEDICTIPLSDKFISKICLQNCMALSKSKKKNQETSPTHGSPHHQLCTMYSGRPLVAYINYKNTQKKTALCFFKDKSFIDLFSLGEMDD